MYEGSDGCRDECRGDPEYCVAAAEHRYSNVNHVTAFFIFSSEVQDSAARIQ